MIFSIFSLLLWRIKPLAPQDFVGHTANVRIRKMQKTYILYFTNILTSI